jgi:hypothetical protein
MPSSLCNRGAEMPLECVAIGKAARNQVDSGRRQAGAVHHRAAGDRGFLAAGLAREGERGARGDAPSLAALAARTDETLWSARLGEMLRARRLVGKHPLKLAQRTGEVGHGVASRNFMFIICSITRIATCHHQHLGASGLSS